MPYTTYDLTPIIYISVNCYAIDLYNTEVGNN